MNNTTEAVPANEVQSPWMNVEECVRYLRRESRWGVYKLVKLKGLPCHRVGSMLLFDRAEVDAWVRNRGSKRSKEIKGELSRFESVRQRLQSRSLTTETNAHRPVLLKGGQ